MSIKITISATSINAFQESMVSTKMRLLGAASEAMDATSKEVFDAAQQLVPVQTGALRDSGKITKEDTDTVLRRTISYGSFNVNPKTGRSTASYAARVHEVQNRRHPESYKWLENSLNHYSDQFIQRIADQLRARM